MPRRFPASSIAAAAAGVLLLCHPGYCECGEGERLFFSAWYEGAAYNKALVVHNPTDAALSLDDYVIADCFNGCNEADRYDHWQAFPSGAVIAAGADWVICDEQTQDNIVAPERCNERREFMSNGNDAMFLVMGQPEEYPANVLDMVGDTTTQPPDDDTAGIDAWAVCGIESGTKDHTLQRNPEVCCGSDWSVSADESSCEWEVLPKGSGWSMLGQTRTTGCQHDGVDLTMFPTSAPVVPPTEAPYNGPAPVAATECPAAPATPGDRRHDKTRLRFMQWNVEFLFLASVDSRGSFECPCHTPTCGIDGACEHACCGLGRTDADVHLRYVAGEIMRMNADVVHLVEVCDCGVLHHLLDLLPTGHGYEPYLKFGTDSFTGQNVALLTRIDIIEDVVRDARRIAYPVPDASACAQSFGDQGSDYGLSKNLLARIHPEGLDAPISIVGLHLLSRPDDESRCGPREAQASVGALIATEAEARGDHVIVVGDMNDYDDLAIDASGRTPITKALSILHGATSPPMLNVIELLPQTERWSNWWDRNEDCVDAGISTDPDTAENSQLDHILLNAGLVDRLVPDTVRIHHDWNGQCILDGGYNSDHYAVTIEISTVDGGAATAAPSPPATFAPTSGPQVHATIATDDRVSAYWAIAACVFAILLAALSVVLALVLTRKRGPALLGGPHYGGAADFDDDDRGIGMSVMAQSADLKPMKVGDEFGV